MDEFIETIRFFEENNMPYEIREDGIYFKGELDLSETRIITGSCKNTD